MKLKTPEEISIMAEGGRRLAKVMKRLEAAVAVGVTGLELDARAEELIVQSGGKVAFKGYGQPPFPGVICLSINSCVVHGTPSEVTLRSGDVVSIDLGMIYQGFYTDMARSVGVGRLSAADKKLLRVTKQALDIGLNLVRPEVTTGDIGSAIQSFVESHGFSVVRALVGHGIGRSLHEDPKIPNFGLSGSGLRLPVGAVIAIEPMVNAGDWRVTIAANGWDVLTADGSRAAHFEDTVAVTAGGHKILTR